MVNARIVASLDRKRLGTTSSSNPKCHAEAFPIKASDHSTGIFSRPARLELETSFGLLSSGDNWLTADGWR